MVIPTQQIAHKIYHAIRKAHSNINMEAGMNKPTLVILAAGMGSRYGGLKQIDAVGKNNETLLDYSSYDAHVSGFEKVVYIIRKDFEQDFRDRLFDTIAKNINAEYVFQSTQELLTPEQQALSKDRTKPWGTIHAVLCAEKAVHGPFAVLNADDYYGRSAYKTIADHFKQDTISATDHAMVGYILENTMTPAGSVSRAICQEENSYLKSLVEHTTIRYEDNKIISTHDGKELVLTGKEKVSMNFFGFMPSAFDYFNDYFERFLKNNLTAEKAECYLPNAAGEMVATGAGTIRLYESTEKWFGMTYPEDKQTVRNEIAARTDSGYYPAQLWER